MTRKSTSPVEDIRAARPTMKEWPADERPREKLLHRGATSLSDAELLAIVLRVGTRTQTALDLARALLVREGSLRALAGRNAAELMRMPGIGLAKAVELLAAMELGRRVQAERSGKRLIIRSPEDVARKMIPFLRERPSEAFFVLILDAKNGLKAEVELTSGTLNASLVHPREVFKAAIDARAAAVIVVHNHPSGNAEPSREDIEVTRQLVKAGEVVGIPVHDHVIVAGDSYISLAERGILG